MATGKGLRLVTGSCVLADIIFIFSNSSIVILFACCVLDCRLQVKLNFVRSVSSGCGGAEWSGRSRSIPGSAVGVSAIMAIIAYRTVVSVLLHKTPDPVDVPSVPVDGLSRLTEQGDLGFTINSVITDGFATGFSGGPSHVEGEFISCNDGPVSRAHVDLGDVSCVGLPCLDGVGVPVGNELHGKNGCSSSGGVVVPGDK